MINFAAPIRFNAASEDALSEDLCDPGYTKTCSRAEKRSRFRAIDGVCNNIANPFWGSTSIAMRRILEACPRRTVENTRTDLIYWRSKQATGK